METREQVIEALSEGRVTQDQYEIMELFITHAPKGTVRAKKIILWFLRQSNFLQDNIALTIPYKEKKTEEYKTSKEVADAIHGMYSKEIELPEIFMLAGISKELSFHCGVATKRSDDLITFQTGWDSTKQEIVPMEIKGYTIWLSKKSYSRNVRLIEFNSDEALKTKLRYTLSRYSSFTSIGEFYEDELIPRKLLKIK
ncbi:MAG: hypothetical protein WC603_00680 [Candidatus Paceibacterota bacterium]|jgi:hypothetical protein